MAYDVTKKHGFVIVVYLAENFNALRFLQRGLIEIEKEQGYPPDLVFIERFKVAADQKTKTKKDDFEYFGILKIKIPRGVVVTALQVKAEIEKPTQFGLIKQVLKNAAHFNKVLPAITQPMTSTPYDDNQSRSTAETEEEKNNLVNSRGITITNKATILNASEVIKT